MIQNLGELSEFPGALIGALPEFNNEGILPVGDYAPDRSAFESMFVRSGDVAMRADIYDGWNRHREALLRQGLAASARELLNGSYTTAKASPGDIDIAVEVPVQVRSDSLADLEDALKSLEAIARLLAGPEMKALYKCDAYPIYSLPAGHPSYSSVTREAIRYWTKWFGRTRQDKPKGRVWATVGGLP